jgi:spore coat polysaccharide biosynthesis protein SpsF
MVGHDAKEDASMKIIAIIQARMGSTRLPGKTMKDLGGDTVLARVVRRVERSEEIEQVIVATSVAGSDDVIARGCEVLEVACFRGSEDDVLDRYYRAAESVGPDVVVRITSDCPAIDPEIVDKTIRAFREARADYASNALERTYPRGLDNEVMTMATLERTWREATHSYQRAHVTPYVYENPSLFRIVSVKGDTDYSQHRWTLDTPEDLDFLRALYGRMGNRGDFSWREALEVVEHEPALAKMNRHIEQKVLHEG